jgi:hypothetical protein
MERLELDISNHKAYRDAIDVVTNEAALSAALLVHSKLFARKKSPSCPQSA